MKIKWIYKFIPVLIIFSDKLLPESASAYSYVVVVVIRPRERDNELILAHELIHCRQFFRTLGLHAPLYYFSKKYRLKAELEAYRVQVAAKGYSDTIIAWVVRMLRENYDLSMSGKEIGEAARLYYKGK